MSQLDELVTDVAARVADASVEYKAGKLHLNRHAQLRRAVFVRSAGALKHSAAPGRQVYGVPVSGAGTTQFQRFTREELVTLTLRAEDEEALDALFDTIVNAIFEIGGPNVYEDANDYEWAGDDSTNAGKHVSRVPELVFRFRMRLSCQPRALPYAVLAQIDATVTMLDADVEVEGFDPTQLTKVCGWLRNFTSSGDVVAWANALNPGNPAMQTVPARRPSGSVANGYPISVFATNDVLVWALGAENNSNTKFGLALWMRQPISAAEALFEIHVGTNGADVRKFTFYAQTSRRLYAEAFISGSNGRRGTTASDALPVAGTWVWVRVFYDSSGATEDDRLKIYINGGLQALTFSDLSAGGTTGVLPTAAGNALIGNHNDGTASGDYNGEFGRNFYVLQEDLTAQEDADLRDFEAPV